MFSIDKCRRYIKIRFVLTTESNKTEIARSLNLRDALRIIRSFRRNKNNQTILFGVATRVCFKQCHQHSVHRKNQTETRFVYHAAIWICLFSMRNAHKRRTILRLQTITSWPLVCQLLMCSKSKVIRVWTGFIHSAGAVLNLLYFNVVRWWTNFFVRKNAF